MKENDDSIVDKGIVKNNIIVFAGALLCCFLWGSAFPAIKIGYRLCNIDSSETWRIIIFAGVRFFIAGFLVILFASIRSRHIIAPKKDELSKIVFLSLFQTIGQYVFFYLGLALTTGMNAAVIDSLTNFFAIIFASLAFNMEKMNGRKIAGCLLGILGVYIINFSDKTEALIDLPLSDVFGALFTEDWRPATLGGDAMILISALCYGMSSVLIKKYSSEHDMVLFSGYQFMFGGFAMSVFGLVMNMIAGGVSGKDAGYAVNSGIGAVMILLYLALVSSVAYTLWGILLKYNDVSKISIFGFMNPVIGVILSALLLGEGDQLGWKYVIALILVSLGIVIVNTSKKESTNRE